MNVKFIELSPKAVTICDTNYNKNCGNCPLRVQCVSPMPKGVNEWATRVNKLAEVIG